jgi:hypothetical protein
LRTHFWPFTEVMRKIRREVTRKGDGPTVAKDRTGERFSHYCSLAPTIDCNSTSAWMESESL